MLFRSGVTSERPSNNINSRITTRNTSNTDVLLIDNRKLYIIDDCIWEKLRSIYKSKLTLKLIEGKNIKVYYNETDENSIECKILNQFSIMKIIEQCIPLDKWDDPNITMQSTLWRMLVCVLLCVLCACVCVCVCVCVCAGS